jgi:hypothetical protein
MKEATARYRKAKAEVDKVAAEIRRIETRLVGVDAQQDALRAMATKGAVALYMHDSTLEWADGFGDGGNEILEASRRARLVGGVNVLASAAVRNLSDSTKQILEDRRRLVARLRELPPDIWRREADHAEYSHYTLFIMFRHLALHDFLHAYRVEELLLKRDWEEAEG